MAACERTAVGFWNAPRSMTTMPATARMSSGKMRMRSEVCILQYELVEIASSVRQILKVVQALDINQRDASNIHLYKIRHSDPQVVAQELNAIFTSLGYGPALGETLTFLPLARLDALLVVNAHDHLADTVDFWVEKLDLPPVAGKRAQSAIQDTPPGL